MEKKTKLTITLALAVLVITLSLGTAISIAPNGNDAQTAAPIQPEIEEEAQVNAISIQSSNLATTSGESRVIGDRSIYKAEPPYPTILVTITHEGPQDVNPRLDVVFEGTLINTQMWWDNALHSMEIRVG